MMKNFVKGLTVCSCLAFALFYGDCWGMERPRVISDGNVKDPIPTAVMKCDKLDKSYSDEEVISDSDSPIGSSSDESDSPIGSSSDEAEHAVTKEFLANLAYAVLEDTVGIGNLIKSLNDENLTFTTVDGAYWMFLRKTADISEIGNEMRYKISNLLEAVKCRKQAGQVLSEQSLLDEYSSGMFGPFEMSGPLDEFDS